MEEFETALGIVQSKPEKQTNHEIEKDSASFAQAD